MAINRYVTQQNAQYNPLSMSELAFAPQFLRQRHDETMAANQMLQEQLGAYNVHPDFNDPASRLIDPIQQNITSLSEDLANKGINESGAVNRLMKLSGQQKELFSPRGGIGQLQARTQQFQEAQKRIDEDLKDDIAVRDYMKGQLNIGEAKIDPNTGRLQLSDMKTPGYVNPIKEADILDRINTGISRLKPSDLGKFGLEGVTSAGAFNDIYTFIDQTGVEPERAMQIALNMITPDDKASIIQSGMARGISPEETVTIGEGDKAEQVPVALDNFLNRVLNIADASAYKTSKRQRINVADRRAIEDYKRNTTGLNITPGPLVHRDINDILKTNNLEFDSAGENIVEKETTVGWLKGWWNTIADAGRTDSGFTWSPVTMLMDTLESISEIGSKLGRNPGLLKNAANPGMLAMELKTMDITDDILEKAHAKFKEKVKKEITTSVQNFKEAYPELSEMKNSEAYNLLNQSRNEFASVFSDVVAPQDADFSKVNLQIFGNGKGTGDFGRRAVYAGNQKIGTGDQFYKQLGYDNYSEFMEKGQPMVEPGILFAGKTPGALVGNALDSDGQPISFTVEAPKGIAAAAKRPHSMLQLLEKGEFFKEHNNQEAINNFGIPLENPENNSMYYLYDIQRNMPVIIEAPKGLNTRQVKSYYDNNPDESMSFADAVNTSIQTIFYDNPETSQSLRK